MYDQILAIYCICDDFVKASCIYQDPQQLMNDAEVMTTAITAALFFSGNFEKSRQFLHTPTLIPNMLSRSRLNRRLHRISGLLTSLFNLLASLWKDLNSNSIYSVDTFPLSVCDNIRINRCKIYQQEEYRGYQASKKRYYYGLKIHLMVTEKGEPVEVFLTPASFADVSGLREFAFALPEGSTVYADKAYTDYEVEDLLLEAEKIKLSSMRKTNSKRPVPGYVAYLQNVKRKVIETTGSLLSQLLPKSIHAVTAKGFELKAFLFVLAQSFKFLVAT